MIFFNFIPAFQKTERSIPIYLLLFKHTSKINVGRDQLMAFSFVSRTKALPHPIDH